LRGAIKKRVVLFKGVEGYLSDELQLTPGVHGIRVRVLSADGSYDESGSISGTFGPGGEQFLAILFDKHDHSMRLALQAERGTSNLPKTLHSPNNPTLESSNRTAP
jgi:hypothetical protein